MSDLDGTEPSCNEIELEPDWTIKAKRDRAEAEFGEHWEVAHRYLLDSLDGGAEDWGDRAALGAWATNDWIVEKLIRRKEVCLLAAEAATGKTLLLLDLMISLVMGGRWLGHYETFTGQVRFMFGESSAPMLDKRLLGLLLGRQINVHSFKKKYGKRYSLLPPNPKVARLAPILTSQTYWELLRSTLPRIQPELRPRLWIFDPAKTLSGNLADPDIVSRLMDNLRWLAIESDAAVIIGHHFNKGSGDEKNHNNRLWGQLALRDLADNVFTIAGDTEIKGLMHVYGNKVKDGEGDPNQPLFHVYRSFGEVTYQDVVGTLRALGGCPTGDESPDALHRIELRFTPYRSDLDPKRVKGDTEHPIDLADVGLAARPGPRPTPTPELRVVQDPDEALYIARIARSIYGILRREQSPLGVYQIHQLLVQTEETQPSIRVLREGLELLKRNSCVLVEQQGKGEKYQLNPQKTV